MSMPMFVCRKEIRDLEIYYQDQVPMAIRVRANMSETHHADVDDLRLHQEHQEKIDRLSLCHHRYADYIGMAG